MTVWYLRDLCRVCQAFDRTEARRLYLEGTPLPENRMPNDEELYATHYRKVASGELGRDYSWGRECGLNTTLFQPDEPLNPNDFRPFPPLEPPRLDFYDSASPGSRRASAATVGLGHLPLEVYLRGYMPRVTGKPSVESVANMLRRGPKTPFEKGIVHDLLATMAMRHVVVLRIAENLSPRQIGRSALAAGVFRYDLSRYLELFCKREHRARAPGCSDGQADR